MTATRDSIVEGNGATAFCMVQLGSSRCTSIDVLRVRDGLGFAKGSVTGLLYAFYKSGERVDRTNLVRVRIVEAEDTGDQAGTLRFDFAKAWTMRASAEMFR